VHDVETDMDLATGEGGHLEKAISIELIIDGVHMFFQYKNGFGEIYYLIAVDIG